MLCYIKRVEGKSLYRLFDIRKGQHMPTAHSRAVESDHLSERDLAEAYQRGWGDFPRKARCDNPLRKAHILLAQCWEQGWDDHEEDGTDEDPV